MGGWMFDEEQGIGIVLRYFSTHYSRERNGDFMVKTGGYKPVQEIKVSTIGDGMI